MISNASHQVKCDACKATLGEHYPKSYKAISISLINGQDGYGSDQYKQHDFCGEACLRDHLNARSKVAKAMETNKNEIVLDITASDAYKKAKMDKGI
jgi:hypothetical protein